MTYLPAKMFSPTILIHLLLDSYYFYSSIILSTLKETSLVFANLFLNIISEPDKYKAKTEPESPIVIIESGVSMNTIEGWQSGRVSPTLGNLISVLNVLGFDVAANRPVERL